MVASTRQSMPWRGLQNEPTALAAAYFRWIQPGTSAITERAEQIFQSHYELAAQREPGTAVLRTYRSDDAIGLGAAIQIVNDDMPLLVDSVTAALRRAGAVVTEVVHPVFDVTRTSDGRLQAVAERDSDIEDGDHSAGHGSFHESWIHVQLKADTADQVLERAEREIGPLLRDVRTIANDTHAMAETLAGAAERLGRSADRRHYTELADYARLLRWLAEGRFTLLGYGYYQARPGVDSHQVPGTGLGVLRNGANSDVPIAASTSAGPMVQLTNGTVDSLVPGAGDLIFVRIADCSEETEDSIGPDGMVEPLPGDHVFVGTFTVAGLHENILDIPVISRRVHQVLEWAGVALNSFTGQAMLEMMQTFPRTELFSTTTRRLFETVSAVVNVGLRRQVRLFLREDVRSGSIYCLVYVPRDRYSTAVRLQMEELVRAEFRGEQVDYSVRVAESEFAVLYFTVHRGRDTEPADLSEANRSRIEDRLYECARTWGDRLVAAAAGIGLVPATLIQQYADAFPASYRHEFEPSRALKDVTRLIGLAGGGIDTRLYREADAPDDQWRFTLYVAGDEVSLSRVLPVLHSLGVEVADERPYRIPLPNGEPRWIYDFGLRMPVPASEDWGSEDVVCERFSDAFQAMWSGRTEVDGLNELVLRAGLSIRLVVVLRAYAKYLQQAGFAYTFANITRVLLAYPLAARLFTQLFAAQFDPDRSARSDESRADELAEKLSVEIDAVAGLDTDRILRAILGLITATLRTNHYRHDHDGQPPAYLALKLDPRKIAELPQPRPRYEIFVHSPRVEGVHLRFGPVARGGLRWSDRLEDFRTEILGLVKAQAVKNAVIVPVGAKGGFVVKRPPAPSGNAAADRQALQAEGVACYRTFIAGMLDLTDNVDRDTGTVVPPDRVVRRDGDDTYLVVAADKGTAAFSDIANDVARQYGFWLGDAFASGGSVGYDHKAMAITAKGAWESVRRHFAETGVDTQSQDFTVVGIGDMSGDVFGNGMLLSEHIRLVAAFDHRHIFLDPDPDAARSFQERQRMFALTRSSWADYDNALISAGGGVWERTVKSVPISSQVQRALGLARDVTSMSPPDLIRAILLAPVQLLWNGGIGTYIKASNESDAEVGDKANNTVRVDANQLRVKVIGEGGNLGITAAGRIEFCRQGGKCNTDALDNSAGVDCSDREVNIKILLDSAISSGELPAAERNPLLASMTDEVATLVLSDNISQNNRMGLARTSAPSLVDVHRRLLADLEARRGLQREIEGLPSDAEVKRLAEAGRGLTSPELANLLAQVKLSIKADLLDSDLPDSAAFAAMLPAYFPAPLRDRLSHGISKHPLRREIVSTMLVNDIVDNGGITYVFRLIEETGATTTDAVRAFTAAVEIFGLRDLWHRIRTTAMPMAARDALELETERTLDRASRWLLINRPQPIAIGADISRYREGIGALAPTVPAWRPGHIADDLLGRSRTVLGLGAPRELAEEVFLLIHRFPLLDVLDVADICERDAAEVADLYYTLNETFEVQRLLDAVGRMEAGDRWTTLARLAVRDDLYSALRALTIDVLTTTEPVESTEQKITHWQSLSRSRLARVTATLAEIASAGRYDLATLSVAARQVRSVVNGGELSLTSGK
ncbi:NAD-glutamate dehydrogenase [Nocardia sp. CDC160]|uniref:NAD-glutamate dehydrogenase n=1 Tax=Nocardia sp. CDC160 TaxID=3112166 RepID=UPI002DB98B8B|nr:NAD-glutamate dehydrogenase [Nocardia sp. CDC160]MEC3920225.1 NAD-glutamate dehydrogenase [Nocardia sp. CDC160]